MFAVWKHKQIAVPLFSGISQSACSTNNQLAGSTNQLAMMCVGCVCIAIFDRCVLALDPGL